MIEKKSQPAMFDDTACRGCHPLLEVQKWHLSGAKRDQGCALGTVNAIWLVVTGTMEFSWLIYG